MASSPFLLALRRAILEDFEEELVLTSKIAVLQAAGWRRSEIQRKLGASPAALRVAEARAKRVAEMFDRGTEGAT